MEFKVLDWNVGGAKFLEEKKRNKREEYRNKLNAALRTLISRPRQALEPDVITLQEIVRYKEPDSKKANAVPDPNSVAIDLIDPPKGYNYFPSILIDSYLLSPKAKWNKILKDSDWHKNTYFAQGNAMLIKKGTPMFPIWDLSNLIQLKKNKSEARFIEKVHLESGLYFGDRNTEPRAALVMHLIYDPEVENGVSIKDRKPLDIFVINMHLTTLMMEREGIPEIDSLARDIRIGQLEIIFNGIISRYNVWRQQGFPERGERRKESTWETFDRYSPLWILSGDFNFTEESEEYQYIKRRNFIDTVRAERKKSRFGNGTKAKGFGVDPTLTLDYIFAGPKFISLHPLIADMEFYDNRIIHDHDVRVSDHYPTVSYIPLTSPL
ncbi:MAG: hypothetical protein V3V99_12355 [candidate division Zixibacteria bacterium]